MDSFSKPRSHSHRSAGVLLLVGILAGVSVGGGVGVIAASSTKTVTVCANKKTNVLRYAKNGKCVTKSETKVLLNQTGSDGTTGVAGAKGDPGATGPKGDTGAAGTSSPTGFTARSVCGANGTTLCAVGVQGPGGGVIVYVDSTNEMPGYDYLEVAPADGVFALSETTGVWATTTAKCGTAAGTSCQTSYLSDAGTALGYIGLGTGRAATAAIVARHTADAVDKASYAAGVADAYTTEKASDWFLPSKDELNEVCKYASNTGQAAGADIVCTGGSAPTFRGFASGFYWSSSEVVAGFAWVQGFSYGTQANDGKLYPNYVRPVRAF
jgi:hypothetical protein